MLAISTLSSVAMFCVFTYIAPILERVTCVSPHTVTWVLVIFGVGITLGNLVGGKLADWHQMTVILGGFVLLIAIFAVLPFAEPFFIPAVAMIFIWESCTSLRPHPCRPASSRWRWARRTLPRRSIRVRLIWATRLVRRLAALCSRPAMAIKSFRLQARPLLARPWVPHIGLLVRPAEPQLRPGFAREAINL